MFNLKKSLVALLAVLTLHGVEARADTFVNPDVRGFASVMTYPELGVPPIFKIRPVFAFSGPGLTVWTGIPPVGGGDVGNVDARDTCIITPCTPGMVIETNSSFSGIIAPALGSAATVNGVSYYSVQLTGSLNFVSSPIVIPDTPDWFQVTIPFTFSGELTGNAFLPNVVNPIFTATLGGQGLATFRFEDITHGRQSPMYRLEWIDYRFQPIPISIDIKPVTFPNRINPNSNGKIPVAILTTWSFDATTVDPTTVHFGASGTEVAPVQSAAEDVDGDGDIDMVLHFVTQNTGITCGNDSASLTGALFSGVTFKGSDSIETVGCK